jgi:hypothetical protein
VRTLPRWEDRDSGLTDNERSDEFARALAPRLRWPDRRCPRGRRARRRKLLIARAARWNRVSLVLDAVDVEADAVRAGRRRRLEAVSEVSSR